MEKHQHNDGLDDYVRKAFNDYEADTPDDMWDRVEQSLEEDDRRRPVFFLWKRWLAAAFFAGAFLLAGWALGVWYSAEETQSARSAAPVPVENITSKPEVNPVPAASSGHPNMTPASSAAPTGVSPNNAAPGATATATQGKDNGLRSTKRTLHLSEHLISETASLSVAGNTSTVPTAYAPEINSHLPETSTPATVTTNLLTDTVCVSNTVQATTLPQRNPLTTLPFSVLIPESIVSVHLPNDIARPSLQPVKEHTTHQSPQTPAPKTKFNWYAGPFVATHLVRERNTAEVANTRRFVSRQVAAPVSLEAGIRAGASGTSGIGWETGFSIRSVERSTVHTARLRRRDGVISPVNPGSSRLFNFNYSLSSYQGNTEMTLSMEETDTVAPALPDEPLMVRIAATEKTNLLRIPLLFTAHSSFRRFSFSGKAGFTGQFLVKNTVEITEQRAFLGRFRPLTQQPLVVQSRDQRRFIPGYQASMGVEYPIGRRLRATLEATTEGDFTLRDHDGNKLPALVHHGLRAGVIWML